MRVGIHSERLDSPHDEHGLSPVMVVVVSAHRCIDHTSPLQNTKAANAILSIKWAYLHEACHEKMDAHPIRDLPHSLHAAPPSRSYLEL